MLINSINLRKRADVAIAHGSLTNSKRPDCFVKGVYPTHFTKGFNSTLVDVDNIQYLDFICGLGTNLFGYGNPQIARAVSGAMHNGGSVFSFSSDLEVELAEKMKETFPFLDRVRFLKTGSEGCAAAVRIARAYTGRQEVMAEGYHGWHDQFICSTKPATGVVDHHMIWPLKDMYEEIICRGAAVIVEPVITDMGPERVKFLQELRDDCTKYGTLLIFDETITAYRFPEYSVAKHLNILPDLWVGGKAIGGGLPLSVVGGKKQIMECDYFVSSTWAGDRLAIAAGLEANKLVHEEYKPNDLWIYGTEFLERFNAISKSVQIEGYPSRGIFKYSDRRFQAMFMQEMCHAGILIGPSWFYNKHLHREIKNILSIVKGVVQKIERGMVRIEGSIPESPFAQKVRNDAEKS